MNPALAALLKRAEHIHSLIEDLSSRVTEENRNLNGAELTLIKGWKDELRAIDEQVEPLQEIEERLVKHNQTVASLTPDPQRAAPGGEPRTAGVRAEPRPLWRHAGEFVRDMVGSFPNQMNGGVVDQEMAARVQQHMQQREVTTEETPGLLPENIVGQVLNDVDGDRPFVQSLGVKPLGTITGKTFERPYVSTHTSVLDQGEELTPLPKGTFVVESVPFTKRAAGGALEVSRQDIDWTDPAAWKALLDDLNGIYAEHTEDSSVGALENLVTQTVAAATDDLDGWIDALYEAAYKALTRNGTTRARVRRIPNAVWTAPDMWAKIGAAIDKARAQNRPEVTGLGSGGVGTVNGTILDIPRIMVPGLSAGKAILGRTTMTEFYEQRIGMLQAVLPAKVGVELAVPGFYAYGTLDETAFCEITAPGAPLAARGSEPEQEPEQVEPQHVGPQHVGSEQVGPEQRATARTAAGRRR